MNKLWFTVINRNKRAIGLVVLCIMLSGCGGPKPESREAQQNKKALKVLEDLESQNERLIQMLKGPSAQEGQTGQGKGQRQGASMEGGSAGKDSQKPEEPEKETETKESQKEGAQEKGDQGEGAQKTEGQKQASQKEGSQEKEGQGEGDQKKEGPEEGSEKKQGEEKQGEEKKSSGDEASHQGGVSQESQDILLQGEPLDDEEWQKINEGIVELHELFNEYMPLAMKQGVSQDLNNHATDALNRMTMEAEKREHLKTLLEANSLSGYISEFYALHQDKRAPIKRSIYYTRGIILASLANDWQSCEAAMNELKSIWGIQKPNISEREKDMAEKTDRAVADLEIVIGEVNQNLVKIKGNILIINLTELEMTLKTQTD